MVFALKGDIVYSKNLNELIEKKNNYLICIDGKCAGIYKNLPAKYKNIKVIDYSNKLIIPGLVDMHLHPSQYSFIGLHMDMQLIDWLNKCTFIEEAKFKNLKYAKTAYDIFIDNFKKSATTRFCMFATIHYDSTLYLMRQLEKIGFKGFVGKVNMDRNTTRFLKENTNDSIKKTIKLIEATKDFKNIKPIVTPRFIPSCSDKLLKELSEIAKNYNIPIQSHLSENIKEIKWVKKLVKNASSYEEAYYNYGLLGNYTNTVMAHYIWPDETTLKLMKNNKVFIAHCPSSNRNISSGVAPIKKYLEYGINVGLATDISAGSNLSMFKCIEDAITSSKIRSLLIDNNYKYLKFSEAFYLATIGGGKFFGKVGSFEKDYELDALVIDDKSLKTTLMSKLKLKERLERIVYYNNQKIVAKYINGKKVF